MRRSAILCGRPSASARVQSAPLGPVQGQYQDFAFRKPTKAQLARWVADEGVAIIFVSHRYREVLRICDRATVLRNGRVVAELPCAETSVEQLVELTLGQKVAAAFHREWRSDAPGEPMLELTGVHVGARVRGVDLTVRRGEIVSLCGLLGSGQNQLARAVAGDASDVSGSLRIKGVDGVPRSPRDGLRRGVALITENRQEEGLFPDMSVRSNISISSLRRIVSVACCD